MNIEWINYTLKVTNALIKPIIKNINAILKHHFPSIELSLEKNHTNYGKNIIQKLLSKEETTDYSTFPR